MDGSIAPPSPARAWRHFIGRKLAALSSVVLLSVLAFAGYYERAYARLDRDLDRDLADARAYRWERPVLRGAMGDGNATDAIYAALADWRAIGAVARRDLAEKVYFGQPLTAAQSALLRERGPVLRALRDSTQQRWAHTELALERGQAMRVPDYPLLIEMGLTLLAAAQTSPPEDCLQQAADVIRVGQDIVPSAPLEATSAATHLVAFAGRVMPRCALKADLMALRRAGHELRVLATHPAPVGSCIEIEELNAASEARGRAALANKGEPWHVVSAIWQRPQLLAAWSIYDKPVRFRQLSPDHYPDAMEEWKREQDYRLHSGPSETAAAAGQALAYLQEDMRGQAIVRMLAIGLSALAERAYRGNLPAEPSALRDAGLIDPYRGQPFHFRISSNGAEFAVWSTGPDFRDDDGSDEWTEAGPRDVALHFPLR
jgi:hypothetical protein